MSARAQATAKTRAAAARPRLRAVDERRALDRTSATFTALYHDFVREPKWLTDRTGKLILDAGGVPSIDGGYGLAPGPALLYGYLIELLGTARDGKLGTFEPPRRVNARYLIDRYDLTHDEIQSWTQTLGERHVCKFCVRRHALVIARQQRRGESMSYTLVRCENVRDEDAEPIVAGEILRSKRAKTGGRAIEISPQTDLFADAAEASEHDIGSDPSDDAGAARPSTRAPRATRAEARRAWVETANAAAAAAPPERLDLVARFAAGVAVDLPDEALAQVAAALELVMVRIAATASIGKRAIDAELVQDVFAPVWEPGQLDEECRTHSDTSASESAPSARPTPGRPSASRRVGSGASGATAPRKVSETVRHSGRPAADELDRSALRDPASLRIADICARAGDSKTVDEILDIAHRLREACRRHQPDDDAAERALMTALTHPNIACSPGATKRTPNPIGSLLKYKDDPHSWIFRPDAVDGSGPYGTLYRNLPPGQREVVDAMFRDHVEHNEPLDHAKLRALSITSRGFIAWLMQRARDRSG